ncbi:glutathione transport system permease protein GsiD [Filimonas sp.]|nr:glutathione transport system permease protein GsiD [Filimonas sp.]
MQSENSSRFWKRFRKNKAALGSLFFIVTVILVAFFAYPLSPDDTTDANTLMVELGTREPGFACSFLKTDSKADEQKTGVFNYLINGRQTQAALIPISSYKFTTDSIHVQHILDENSTETLSFSLKQLDPDNHSTDQIRKKWILHRTFWLGTDRYGRDVLSRLLIGTRVSMAVGFIAVLISIFIGVLLGALSGYFGGWADQIVTWLINVLWAIPTLLLVFAITFALGKGFWQIFVAVGFTMWVGTARLIRGQVMALKELEYIQAAKVMGFSSLRIIVKHILPNVLGPTIVMAASNFATAILIEAGLSFLGIGVQPPTSSWGLMIKENYNFIITNHPMLAIIPGIAIMLIVLAFNLLGNALRDALDVKG